MAVQVEMVLAARREVVLLRLVQAVIQGADKPLGVILSPNQILYQMVVAEEVIKIRRLIQVKATVQEVRRREVSRLLSKIRFMIQE